VSETPPLSQIRSLISNSLFEVAEIYHRRSNGDLQFDGERPGSGWHVLGYFAVTVVMLVDGNTRKVRLWKRRFRLYGTNTTCHSRPPDFLPGYRFCSLVVTLKLWAWIDSELGLHNYPEFLPSLQDCGSRRSVQRWLRRLQPQALGIQQAVRLAAIERCEPRPLERLFPAGLSPPARVCRKRWQDTKSVSRLWRALSLLFGVCTKLTIPLAIMLAEARGRFADLKTHTMK
jgi:hypothetical protein